MNFTEYSETKDKIYALENKIRQRRKDQMFTSDQEALFFSEFRAILEKLPAIVVNQRGIDSYGMTKHLFETMNSLLLTINLPDRLEILNREGHLNEFLKVFMAQDRILKNHFPQARFEQSELKLLVKKSTNSALKKIIERYNGLCDLICNLVVNNHWLDSPDPTLTEKISLEAISDQQIVESHLIENIMKRKGWKELLRIAWGVFRGDSSAVPNSITSSNIPMTKKNNKYTLVSEQAINELDKLTPGTCIKFCAYKLKFGFPPIQGHSMLIKKTSENEFTFFDPDKGAIYKLDKTDLESEMNNGMHGIELIYDRIALMHTTLINEAASVEQLAVQAVFSGNLDSAVVDSLAKSILAESSLPMLGGNLDSKAAPINETVIRPKK